METTTQNQTTVEQLRSIYLQPKKQHPVAAHYLIKELTQDQLIKEFCRNHNALLVAGQKEKGYRESYGAFLLQHIRYN